MKKFLSFKLMKFRPALRRSAQDFANGLYEEVSSKDFTNNLAIYQRPLLTIRLSGDMHHTCYHVQVFSAENGCLFWDSFPTLSEARKQVSFYRKKYEREGI